MIGIIIRVMLMINPIEPVVKLILEAIPTDLVLWDTFPFVQKCELDPWGCETVTCMLSLCQLWLTEAANGKLMK